MSGSIRASIRSAARRRIAARSVGGIAARAGAARVAGGQRPGDLVGAPVTGEAHDVARIGGVQDRIARLVLRRVWRKGAPRGFGACGEAPGELGQTLLVGEIEPARIQAIGRVEVARRRDLVVRRPDRLDRASDGHGVGREVVDAQACVGDAVDERGVGAVLEQAANEIGEQRLVRADRRIDPARAIELVAADHLFVKRLAHPVQALEFVLAAIEIGTREDEDGGERLCVVGRELRKDRIRRREQLARARKVADVGIEPCA